MVDALAHTLRRSRKPEFALRVLVHGAWRRIRVTQRAPRSKSPSQMLPSLPSGLKVILAEADAAIQGSVNKAEAVSLGRRLEDQLDAYEKDSRQADDQESKRPSDAA
jgi:hypothetical protein